MSCYVITSNLKLLRASQTATHDLNEFFEHTFMIHIRSDLLEDKFIQIISLSVHAIPRPYLVNAFPTLQKILQR